MDNEINLEGLTKMNNPNLIFQYPDENFDNSYFSKHEILHIISKMKDNYNHLVWFKVLYSFGMTLQELRNLRVKDIDFEKFKLTVNTSKRSTPRKLDIPKTLLYDLRIQCSHKFQDAYVFQGRCGKLHTRTIQKVFEKVESRINSKITIAKLRKSIAIHLLQSGWEYKSIGEFLGHASYRTTRKLLGPASYFNKKSNLPIDEILQ